VNRKKEKGLSGGKKFGPPPKKGPNPQGLELNGKKLSKKLTKKSNKIR
jgi:hypothetical protein